MTNKKNKTLLTIFVTIFVLVLVIVGYTQIAPQLHLFIQNMQIGNVGSVLPHLQP